MNDILFNSNKNAVERDHMAGKVTDDELDCLLKEIRERERLNAAETEKDQINNILDDIENEFKELDDILKEADELTLNYNETFGANEYQGYAPSDWVALFIFIL